jgi:peroxiredoxin
MPEAVERINRSLMKTFTVALCTATITLLFWAVAWPGLRTGRAEHNLRIVRAKLADAEAKQAASLAVATELRGTNEKLANDVERLTNEKLKDAHQALRTAKVNLEHVQSLANGNAVLSEEIQRLKKDKLELARDSMQLAQKNLKLLQRAEQLAMEKLAMEQELASKDRRIEELARENSTLVQQLGQLDKEEPREVPSQSRASTRQASRAVRSLPTPAFPSAADKYNAKVLVGTNAPTFPALPAIHDGAETTVSLSDLKEDVVVLVFLASHCPVVGAYEDRLIDFTKDYKDKGVRVVGVAVSGMEQDKLHGIKAYVKEHKSNYVYAYDESQDIGRNYGATNTPQFFVLDKERVIRYMGSMDDNVNESKVTRPYLRDAVDAVLQGRRLEVEETRPIGCSVKYQ